MSVSDLKKRAIEKKNSVCGPEAFPVMPGDILDLITRMRRAEIKALRAEQKVAYVMGATAGLLEAVAASMEEMDHPSYCCCVGCYLGRTG